MPLILGAAPPASEPERLPPPQGCICLLKLAVLRQAIVTNVSLTWRLSAGTGSPSVTGAAAAGFTSNSDGHYLAGMG